MSPKRSPRNCGVNAILSASGKWRIDETGLLVVEEVHAKRGTFEEKLEVGSQIKPKGITIYDTLTGEPYCTTITGGEWQKVKGECERDYVGKRELED